ncbi:MAG TPA: SAF domain-containing protein [Nocardioides sp.]|nr:SAF domain-containing protein [Nocardioides sp.]
MTPARRSVPVTLRTRSRHLRRAVLRHRRPLAALLAGLAVAAALQTSAAPAGSTVPALVAARDLAPGTELTAGDLTTAAFRPGSVPDGALALPDAIGRRVVGPVRAGEPLTDVRLLDDALLARYPGTAAVPVRLGDAEAAALLRVGDRVTLLAADPQSGGPALAVAEGAPVLALPRPRREQVAAAGGALVVLALDAGTARVVAGAASRSFLSAAVVR